MIILQDHSSITEYNNIFFGTDIYYIYLCSVDTGSIVYILADHI